MIRPLLLTALLSTAAWAEGDRYLLAGMHYGALAGIGPADGADDARDRVLGVDVDTAWRTDHGWLLLALRVSDQLVGGDLGWQLNPDWGVAPVIGARLGGRRLRRGWRTPVAAGETVRSGLIGALDLGIRYRPPKGFTAQVLVRPGMTLLTAQRTESDRGAVRAAEGVVAPAPFRFAELTVCAQVGWTW